MEIATAITNGQWSRAAYYSGQIGTSKSLTISNVQARYVKLTLKGITEYLQLCEIEIYGYNGRLKKMSVNCYLSIEEIIDFLKAC